MKQLIAPLIAMVHRMSFLFLSLLLVSSLTTMAAAQTTDVNTQLKNVADKIRAKTVAWKMPEAELAPELEELASTISPLSCLGAKMATATPSSWMNTPNVPGRFSRTVTKRK